MKWLTIHKLILKNYSLNTEDSVKGKVFVQCALQYSVKYELCGDLGIGILKSQHSGTFGGDFCENSRKNES